MPGGLDIYMMIFLIIKKTCKQKPNVLIVLIYCIYSGFKYFRESGLTQKPIFLLTVYDAQYKDGVDRRNLLRPSPEKKRISGT